MKNYLRHIYNKINHQQLFQKFKEKEKQGLEINKQNASLLFQILNIFSKYYFF